MATHRRVAEPSLWRVTLSQGRSVHSDSPAHGPTRVLSRRSRHNFAVPRRINRLPPQLFGRVLLSQHYSSLL